MQRCDWCEKDEIYRAYHDDEWGEVVRDERVLFEFLVLEIMQVGLSWHTILKKREAMRVAFDGFDPHKIARYDDAKISQLLQLDGIIRHRGKIGSLPSNARAFLAVQAEFGSFFEYIWAFVGGVQLVSRPKNLSEIKPRTPLSDRVSADMKRRGFKFVGSIAVQSFLQACRVINEHLEYCFKV